MQTIGLALACIANARHLSDDNLGLPLAIESNDYETIRRPLSNKRRSMPPTALALLLLSLNPASSWRMDPRRNLAFYDRPVFRARPVNLVAPPDLGQRGLRHRFLFGEATKEISRINTDAYGWTSATPTKSASYRLDFIIPGVDREELKSLELAKSHPSDSPSFGAVRVQLPVDATVSKSGSNLVVKHVVKDSNAFLAGLRENDIIRAVSVPAARGEEEEEEEEENSSSIVLPVPIPVPPVFVPVLLPSLVPIPPVPMPVLMPPVPVPLPLYRRARLRKPSVPQSEEGLVFFDGRPVTDYDVVLREHERRNGRDAEVVFVIERPGFEFSPLDSNDDVGESKAILQQLEDAVKTNGPDLVRQAGAVSQLIVGDNKLHVDLKNGDGAVKWGEDKADLIITMSDEDFKALVEGDLDGVQALMSSKMKIQGNVMLAQRLIKRLGPMLETTSR